MVEDAIPGAMMTECNERRQEMIGERVLYKNCFSSLGLGLLTVLWK